MGSGEYWENFMYKHGALGQSSKFKTRKGGDKGMFLGRSWQKIVDRKRSMKEHDMFKELQSKSDMTKHMKGLVGGDKAWKKNLRCQDNSTGKQTSTIAGPTGYLYTKE